MINQVLDLAKIEAGHVGIERIEMDLVQTVDDVASFIAERAHAKGLKVKAFASPKLPTLVLGDPTRLREVLINLLGNAVKFTDEGEIGIWVESSQNTDRILFRIWDTGIGIDSAVIPNLFQPFVQADESTTRRFGGTGLGLMICKELVEAMGGAISVQSEQELGSEFQFSLPLEPTAGVGAREAPLDRCSALLVCREDFLCRVLTCHIGCLGATVTLARSSEQARKALEAKEEDYQLLVVDNEISDFSSVVDLQAVKPSILCLRIKRELDGSGQQAGDHGEDACLNRLVTYSLPTRRSRKPS